MCALSASCTALERSRSGAMSQTQNAKNALLRSKVKQVQMTVAASPGTKAFVYRNMVKALPWFTSVREKITDPAYSPWFMNFSAAVVADHTKAHVPVCDDNYHPPLCSDFYHDQSQTPGFPHGDGNCAPPACDVGSVPVGEWGVRVSEWGGRRSFNFFMPVQSCPAPLF